MIATTTAADLTPCERTVLAVARALAAATGAPPEAHLIARRTRYASSTVRGAVVALDARGLWPWPRTGRGGARHRGADWKPRDRQEFEARCASVRRGEDPDDPGAPLPGPDGFGRPPVAAPADPPLIRSSRTYRRLVALLARRDRPTG